MNDEIRNAALLELVRDMARGNLIGTDIADARAKKVRNRDFSQQPGGTGVQVTFSISWHALGKLGEVKALDQLLE